MTQDVHTHGLPGRRRSWSAALLAAVIGGAAAIAPAATVAVGETVGVYLTTADGASQLAQQTNVTLGAVSNGTINVRVNDSLTYQTLVGFGAAFTDSSAFLMNRVKSYSTSMYNTIWPTCLTQAPGSASPIGGSRWGHPISPRPQRTGPLMTSSREGRTRPPISR